MKRILIAYDGSNAADKAFALGLDLASKYEAEIHVLSVARPPDYGSEVETEAIIEQGKQHCHQLLKPLQASVKQRHDLSIHFDVRVGHPAEQIVRYAEGWPADLVVIGHRGRTFLERWLLGSVARQVINHSPCAVLIAR